MILRIDFDSHRFKTWLSDLEKKQIPYATSRAMNDASKVAVLAAREHAKKQLTIRKNGFFEKGINYVPTRKTDKPIRAIIYSKSKWAERNETDSPITKSQGKKLSKPWKIRETPLSLVKRSEYASALVGKIKNEKSKKRKRKSSKNKSFMIRTKKRKIAIVKREGKNRKPLVFLYVFEKEIKWKQKFKFEENVTRIVRGIFAKRFETRFKESMRSPKK